MIVRGGGGKTGVTTVESLTTYNDRNENSIGLLASCDATVTIPRLYLPAPEVVVRKREVFKHTKAVKQV